MKTYQSCIKGIAGLLVLIAITSGCSREEGEGGTEVPLNISAAFPDLLGDRTTRAGSTQVEVALNATGGDYAANAKTYDVASSGTITLTPDGSANTLSISGSIQSTPLTIYGWLNDNTPVYYSDTSTAVDQGKISNIELTPAFACIGVRIVSNSTEAAGRYTIASSRLKGIGTYTSNADWNTSGQIPALRSNSSPLSIRNTDKASIQGSVASEITTDYFMRVIPDNITSTSDNLFTVNLPNGQLLQIPAGKTINITAGNCYLFTIDIGRETALEISSIEEMQMSDVIEIPVYNRTQKGIYTLQELKYFRDLFNYGSIWDEDGNQIHKSLNQWVENGVVTLRADIDLGGEPWVPIGIYDDYSYNGEKAFYLTFDGNGHTISNLNIQSESNSNSLYSSGFFSLVTGTVKGLTIDGAVISYGGHLINAGVIAGSLWEGFIYDCHVKGTVKIDNSDDHRSYTGGIVGEVSGGSEPVAIAACTVQTDASSKFIGKHIGGILGAVQNGQVHIVGCIAHDITFNEESDAGNVERFGGITPAHNGECFSCVAYNCEAYYQDYNGYGISPMTNWRSYFFNVAGIDGGGEEGLLYSMEELNSESTVGYLYNNAEHWQISEEKKMSHHYHASPTPSLTGPYLLPGRTHDYNGNECGFRY